MISNSPLRAYLSKEFAFLLLASLLAFAYLIHWHLDERSTLEKRFIAEQLAVAKEKRASLESVMKTIYQNVRTITLLPSIRAIKGGNRVGDREDVVATGRFSAEGRTTVQQIYNNMASLVSLSEIYAVLDGFDAGKGEIPFFMFDALVFGDGPTEAEESKPADFPEESEDAEYAYFPHQLAAIRAAHPRFQYREIDDIPAFASPLMRTCDNTQYLSTASGNVHDSFGLLYSVPFYDAKGSFRGVISAILRSNVLEALLIGAPFVPVTDADRAEQQRAQWKMPEPARFELSNAGHGVRIADRRSTTLANDIAGGIEGRNVFRLSLEIPSDSPWELTYFLPESMIDEALAEHERTFLILVAVVLGALVAAGLAIYLLSGIRSRLGGRTEEVAQIVHAVSEGNLIVDFAARGKANSVLANMGTMVGALSSHMRAIDLESKQIAQSSYQISEISARIANASEQEQARSDEVRVAMHEMTGATEEVLALSSTVTSHAERAREAAQEGQEAVRSNIAEMREVLAEVASAESKITQLSEANAQIHAIVRTIASITDQTNLLALNAAIEAARAGEAGRGFAVVADEVRKLAASAGTATQDISRIIDNLGGLVVENTSAMERVIARTRSGMERAEGSHAVIERIVTVIDGNADAAHRISSVGSEQKQKLDALEARFASLQETLVQNSMKVHTTGAIGQDLYHVTERLRTLIQHFRFDQTRTTEPSLNENRRAPRYRNHLLVRIDDRGTEREALTADLSMSGARLRVPMRLESQEGEFVSLKLMQPLDNLDAFENQQPLTIEARILWRRDSTEGLFYGVEFQPHSAEERRRLTECFAFFNQQPSFPAG